MTNSQKNKKVDFRSSISTSPPFYYSVMLTSQPHKPTNALRPRRSNANNSNPYYQSQYSSKIFPNGEYTVGFVPPRNPEKPKFNRFISSSNSEQLQKKYGTTGITPYGRRSLRNGVFLLKKRYGSRRLGFYTATLPSVSNDFLKTIVSEWHNITHRFFQELRREAQRMGCPDYDYVYCIEIQEKRSRVAGLPIPHIHWVAPAFTSRDNKFLFSANKLREIWARVVSHYSSEITSYEASIDCRLIKKDVERYMSKYLSKSSTKNGQGFVNDSGISFACRWWGFSKKLGRFYKSQITRDTDAIARNLIDISFMSCKEFTVYSCEICRKNEDGIYIRIGYVGKLNALGLSYVQC